MSGPCSCGVGKSPDAGSESPGGGTTSACACNGESLASAGDHGDGDSRRSQSGVLMTASGHDGPNLPANPPPAESGRANAHAPSSDFGIVSRHVLLAGGTQARSISTESLSSLILGRRVSPLPSVGTQAFQEPHPFAPLLEPPEDKEEDPPPKKPPPKKKPPSIAFGADSCYAMMHLFGSASDPLPGTCHTAPPGDPDLVSDTCMIRPSKPVAADSVSNPSDEFRLSYSTSRYCQYAMVHVQRGLLGNVALTQYRQRRGDVWAAMARKGAYTQVDPDRRVPPTYGTRHCAGLIDIDGLPLPSEYAAKKAVMPYSDAEVFLLGIRGIGGIRPPARSGMVSPYAIFLGPPPIVSAWNGALCITAYERCVELLPRIGGAVKRDAGDGTMWEFLLRNAINGAHQLFGMYRNSVTSRYPEFTDPSFVAAMSCIIAEDTVIAFERLAIGRPEMYPEVRDMNRDTWLNYTSSKLWGEFASYGDALLPRGTGMSIDDLNSIVQRGKAFGRAHVIPAVAKLMRYGYPQVNPHWASEDCIALSKALAKIYRNEWKTALMRVPRSWFNLKAVIDIAVTEFRKSILVSIRDGMRVGDTKESLQCASLISNFIASR